MNLFFLSLCIETLAYLHCDKHVVKMPLETCQMLYTAHRFFESSLDDAPLTKTGKRGYKKTHYNHPITKWVRDSKANYLFACKVGLALCKEYTKRYGKIHACQQHIDYLYRNVPTGFSKGELTIPPQAMPEIYKCHNPKSFNDVISAYKRYYIFEKLGFAKWKNTSKFSQETYFSIQSLTVKELRNVANKKGLIKNSKYIKKDDLINLIKS